MTILLILSILVTIFVFTYTSPRLEIGKWIFHTTINNIFRVEYDNSAACKCRFFTIGKFYIVWLSKDCTRMKLENRE